MTAAGVPGPYVLAGHSFGGLLARLYAATYPDEVVGLVLVDAFSEAVRAGLTPRALADLAGDEWRAAAGPAGDLPGVRTDRHRCRGRRDGAGGRRPSFAATIPLVVLSAGHTGEMTPDQVAALPPGYPEALPAALQANSAFLASLVPDARLVCAADSGHYIQAEAPGAGHRGDPAGRRGGARPEHLDDGDHYAFALERFS